MKKQKKPLKSKPAAKKKAVRKPHPLARDSRSRLPEGYLDQLIVGIAAHVDEIAADLKAIHQKLDYLLVRAAPLNREEWHPLVEKAEQALEKQ